MNLKLFSSLCAATLIAATLSSPRVDAAVVVYGEASSSGPAITVNVFADLTNAPLVSFGVRVLYDPYTLSVSTAAKNTQTWHFSTATGQAPYLDPDTATPGEVLIIGGKLDAASPLQGVSGKRVLLGTVTFGRLTTQTPKFSLALGRAVSYANFVTTTGNLLDSAPDGVLFQGVTPDAKDTDLDGLPDDWEIRYFGSIDKYSWNDDPDGDGFDNLHEYLADTNPNDKTSYLRLSAARYASGGISLHWTGGVEATQYLQRCVTLDGDGGTWTDIYTNPPPTPTVGGYTNLFGTNGVQFYRIRATR